MKTSEDRETEDNVVGRFISQLPGNYQTELGELFAEMNALETQEARVYKALDRMEALIQHNEADISTWLPLEYELQMTYGEKEVQFSEYIKELKAEANRISAAKIQVASEMDEFRNKKDEKANNILISHQTEKRGKDVLIFRCFH